MASVEASSGPRVKQGDAEIHKNPSPLKHLLKDLGMTEYYPCKLSLQTLRTIEICPDGANVGPPRKEDLPWSILKQIMLLNKQCREDDITKFAKTQPKSQKKVFGKLPFGKDKPGRVSKVPHPMDVMQVLFMCSDYAVRQILARKLFMCRLAIPFIIPSDRVEVMLWPLRSIILEWKCCDEAEEEALVKCNINMVAFIKYGENEFSKSSLMNDVLSASGHATFFHKGSPCGNEKRVISNGTVDMSHFLPEGNDQDAFKQPALFFNLRGDACSHDVQRQVLMDLATVLVIVVDISELRNTTVQEVLKETVTTKQGRVVIAFTDNDKHDQSEIDELNELFCTLVGDDIEKIDVVTTFGEEQNASSVIQGVREAVAKKMEKSDVSLEQFVTSKLAANCDVDENVNEHCRRGKKLAENILKEVNKVGYRKMKETLLPKQGKCLSDLGEELRNLHRTSRDRGDPRNMTNAKEAIQKKIDDIRKKQRKSKEKESFMKNLISMFHGDQESREFAMRWLQMALDDLSRFHLPKMNKEKITCWDNLVEARNKGEKKQSSQLEGEFRRIEENIESATCGWEHLMRELGQMYEVSLALKDSISPQLSFLPELVGRQLLEGHPVELMDGDHGVVPIDWVKAVFKSVSDLDGNKKIFILSVLGVQSSGKSTFLNTMFGLEFAVSAGRCTRGIYTQLLPVKDHQNRFDYLLVLDSEGLRSQQRRKKYQYDNELATLVIGLSDLAIINLKGESITEMEDVLEIVVHAFLRMKLADSPQKRQCVFVHQNVAAVNAQEKLADDRQKLQEQLNLMTKQASIALGLSDAITSFNRIIGFDGKHDVVYFPDLWSGDPPMAVVNQGYSRKASDMQQTILHRVTHHFNSFISIEDFASRAEDMWNGVLSDDFIFSFRNTLAAKAYIEVEREFVHLTSEMENELLSWMTTQCEPQITNCETENTLEECWNNIDGSLSVQISEHMEQKERLLLAFFDEHDAPDIVSQWKSEKLISFQTWGNNLKERITNDLHNSKGRKLIQLRTNSDICTRKEEIQKSIFHFAGNVRKQCQSYEDIAMEFDTIWKTWASEVTRGCKQIKINVLQTFNQILREQFTSDERQYLERQLNATALQPNASRRMYTLQDFTSDHIIAKEHSGHQGQVCEDTEKEADVLKMVAEAANEILRTVLQTIDDIAVKDIPFTNPHGKETLDVLLRAIDSHNKLPFDKAEFALTHQFKAMLAVRTSCIAIVEFEAMNERYEKQFGVQAHMDEYRQRLFGLFKNAVEEAAPEITAANYFCATLKAEVVKHVTAKMKIELKGHILKALGTSKRTFLITMLEEFTESRNYDSLHAYALNPSGYAAQWLKQYTTNYLFARKDAETQYSVHANQAARKIFAKIKASIVDAASKVSHKTGPKQYDCFLDEFCQLLNPQKSLLDSLFAFFLRNRNRYFSTNARQLRVEQTATIQDFAKFQQLLTSSLDSYQTETEREFQQLDTVAWLDSQSQKIYKDLWGCTEHCPFCIEPCQFTDANHKRPHKCIQHKPGAVKGEHWYRTDRLYTYTCDFAITTALKFHCRGKCVCNKKEYSHCCMDYKKYFPKWDIAPDPSGRASKYWQWVMCTFQQELQESYSGMKLEVKDQWKEVTKQEATASLRKW